MNQSLEAILRRLAKEWGADEEATLRRVSNVWKLSLEATYHEAPIEPSKAKHFDQESAAVLIRASSGRKAFVLYSKSYLDKDRVKRLAVCVIEADTAMLQWISGKTVVVPNCLASDHGWVQPAPTLDEYERPSPISERHAQKGLKEADRPPRR